MVHIPLDITDHQRQNLKTLAEYLVRPEVAPLFDMTTYIKGGGTPCTHEPDAVADAIGHGPRAGITPEFGEEWEQYCERCFTGLDMDWCIFNFLFAQEWAEFDNTPSGVADRINYLLNKNECPFLGDDFLFLPEQMGDLYALYK